MEVFLSFSKYNSLAMRNRQTHLLALICFSTNLAFGQFTLSGPSLVEGSYPTHITYCISGATGSSYWQTTGGSWEPWASSPPGTYPVSSISQSVTCDWLEIYNLPSWDTYNVTVTVSNTNGSASKTTTVHPRLYGQAFNYPDVTEHLCNHVRYKVKVTSTYFPSGLIRTGPSNDAYMPHEWGYIDENKNFISILYEPGWTNAPFSSTVPANRWTAGNFLGNPVYDSTNWLSGEIKLYTGALPDSLHGQKFIFRLGQYAGKWLYSDTLYVTCLGIKPTEVKHVSPSSGWVIPGLETEAFLIPNPGHTYTWDAIGGTLIPTNSPDTIRIKWGSPNQHAGIKVTAARNGCFDTTFIPVPITFLGLEERNASIALRVYPNPFENAFHFQLPTIIHRGIAVLMDSKGTLVDSFALENAQEGTFNAVHLPTGTYIITVYDEKGQRMGSTSITKL